MGIQRMNESEYQGLDPRGVIASSYEIENLSQEEARSIFLDWAIVDMPANPAEVIALLYKHWNAIHPDHPMTKVLEEGVQARARGNSRRRHRKEGLV